jgi:uncharacterized protein
MPLMEMVVDTIYRRIEALDWHSIADSLWNLGYALTGPILTPQECAGLIRLYPSDDHFRSHIIMSRYRFGRGDYKYFKYPLPSIVQELREATYPHLAPVANKWNKALGLAVGFPDKLLPFLQICKKHGQARPTPLLLHYESGDFNCLHQDVYGDTVFPLQLTCFLSAPGEDYDGGEFVLVEQQPRAQSKSEVIRAQQGQIVIFTTRYRPVKGTRGYYRTNLRHGVSRVRRGVRYTLGIIYHDAK